MCQWKLVRADVEVPESANAETFLPDSDDEGDGASAPVEAVPKMIEDSDDEDEEADPEPTKDDDSDDSDDADPPIMLLRRHQLKRHVRLFARRKLVINQIQ